MKPWCIKHKEGWCAVLDQAKKPEDNGTTIQTLCAHFVLMPFGIERRVPTCVDCRALRKDVLPATWKGLLCLRCGRPEATEAAYQAKVDENLDTSSLCWGERANCTREAQEEHIRTDERKRVFAWLQNEDPILWKKLAPKVKERWRL